MDSLLRIFPQKRRAFWQKTADNGEKICEIRLRVDRPVIVETSRGDYFLNNGGEWQEHPYGAHLVTEAEIRELIAWLCQDSVYAYADEIRQGFLTVEGGHRIGLCGQAVLENETVIRTLKNIAFINIRVAHEIRGAADGILPKLYKKGKFQNTLIVSPPGFGKTTLLRDLIRQISDGNTYGAGLRVGVVDERSELAGSYLGRPQNDLGMRTDMDGVDIIQSIRQWSNVPIIVISARSEDTDKIEALDNGADDYLTKPFSVDELLARLRVTQRRLSFMQETMSAQDSVFVNGPLKIDFSAGCACLNEEPLALTPTEYKLLCLMARNVGKVLTHTYITEHVWGSSFKSDVASLRVFMATLRKKLESAPGAPQQIHIYW